MKKILVFVLVTISLFTLSANGLTRKQYLEDINSTDGLIPHGTQFLNIFHLLLAY